MLKKSDIQGDKTPKQEDKGHVSKTASAADQDARTAGKTAAPANEAKKS